jgi:methionyl-tRNA synthetase
VDALRYFLIRDMVLGRDADFTAERVQQRYEGDLANDLGNLLHRLVNMIGRYFQGRIPAPGEPGPEEGALRGACLARIDQAFAQIDDMALTDAVGGVMDTVGEINAYLERTAPWHQARAGDMARVATILYTASEALRLCAMLLEPVMPERTAELYRRLGWTSPEQISIETGRSLASLRRAQTRRSEAKGPHSGLSWGHLQPGAEVVEGPPLFPRDIAQA